MYGVISQAWKSKSFKPTVHFAEIDHAHAQKMSLAEVAANQERKRSVQHNEGLAHGGTDGFTSEKRI